MYARGMYENCDFCVKTEHGISNPFSSLTGVKQGCNLSLTLSSIFQNELHQIFDEYYHYTATGPAGHPPKFFVMG